MTPLPLFLPPPSWSRTVVVPPSSAPSLFLCRHTTAVPPSAVAAAILQSDLLETQPDLMVLVGDDNANLLVLSLDLLVLSPDLLLVACLFNPSWRHGMLRDVRCGERWWINNFLSSFSVMRRWVGFGERW
nr:hypothetical protein Iba_chr14dCG1830 [Ipomoea batatas]